jgi:hypothetical protein
MVGKTKFVIIFAALSFTGLSLVSGSAQAARKGWGWTRGSTSRSWGFGLEGSVRLMTHYNREETILTAPQTALAEGHLNFWYRRSVAFYVAYGQSIAQARSSLVGGGIKLPLLTFSNRAAGGVSGLSLLAVADLVYFSIEPPTAPKIYDATLMLFRYGGALHLGLGNSGFYANATMMLTRHSGNFTIAPQLGVGINF